MIRPTRTGFAMLMGMAGLVLAPWEGVADDACVGMTAEQAYERGTKLAEAKQRGSALFCFDVASRDANYACYARSAAAPVLARLGRARDGLESYVDALTFADKAPNREWGRDCRNQVEKHLLEEVKKVIKIAGQNLVATCELVSALSQHPLPADTTSFIRDFQQQKCTCGGRDGLAALAYAREQLKDSETTCSQDTHECLVLASRVGPRCSALLNLSICAQREPMQSVSVPSDIKYLVAARQAGCSVAEIALIRQSYRERIRAWFYLNEGPNASSKNGKARCAWQEDLGALKAVLSTHHLDLAEEMGEWLREAELIKRRACHGTDPKPQVENRVTRTENFARRRTQVPEFLWDPSRRVGGFLQIGLFGARVALSDPNNQVEQSIHLRGGVLLGGRWRLGAIAEWNPFYYRGAPDKGEKSPRNSGTLGGTAGIQFLGEGLQSVMSLSADFVAAYELNQDRCTSWSAQTNSDGDRRCATTRDIPNDYLLGGRLDTWFNVVERVGLGIGIAVDYSHANGVMVGGTFQVAWLIEP